MNNSTAKDIYNLDAAFIKKYVTILAEPLTYIINMSIRTGQFPEAWKKSLVKPIFKSGNTQKVANYRPISLLPVKFLKKLSQNNFYNIWRATIFSIPSNLALDITTQLKQLRVFFWSKSSNHLTKAIL